MEKMDLSKILFDTFGGWIPLGISESNYYNILLAMKIACDIAIDKCAENADIMLDDNDTIVDKDTILVIKEFVI